MFKSMRVRTLYFVQVYGVMLFSEIATDVAKNDAFFFFSTYSYKAMNVLRPLRLEIVASGTSTSTCSYYGSEHSYVRHTYYNQRLDICTYFILHTVLVSTPIHVELGIRCDMIHIIQKHQPTDVCYISKFFYKSASWA